MASVNAIRALAAAGRWSEIEAALAPDEDLDADQLEILAEACWWSGRATASIALWERALRHAATAGDPERAARLRAWIAIEYQALGNTAAASGWVNRSEALSDDRGAGWLTLAMSATHPEVEGQAAHAATAVEQARRHVDPDLEILSLTRLGIAKIRQGEFGAGLGDVDAAMAAATAGDAQRLRTVGQACCDLVLATELTGDASA